MWNDATNYRDESYYLFNDAINTYRTRLQQIYNRGMIESWIESGNVAQRSLWPTDQTMAYFEKLPYPENETERRIWLAGYNATQEPPDPSVPTTFERSENYPNQQLELAAG